MKAGHLALGPLSLHMPRDWEGFEKAFDGQHMRCEKKIDTYTGGGGVQGAYLFMNCWSIADPNKKK